MTEDKSGERGMWFFSIEINTVINWRRNKFTSAGWIVMKHVSLFLIQKVPKKMADSGDTQRTSCKKLLGVLANLVGTKLCLSLVLNCIFWLLMRLNIFTYAYCHLFFSCEMPPYGIYSFLFPYRALFFLWFCMCSLYTNKCSLPFTNLLIFQFLDAWHLELEGRWKMHSSSLSYYW